MRLGSCPLDQVMRGQEQPPAWGLPSGMASPPLLATHADNGSKSIPKLTPSDLCAAHCFDLMVFLSALWVKPLTQDHCPWFPSHWFLFTTVFGRDSGWLLTVLWVSFGDLAGCALVSVADFHYTWRMLRRAVSIASPSRSTVSFCTLKSAPELIPLHGILTLFIFEKKCHVWLDNTYNYGCFTVFEIPFECIASLYLPPYLLRCIFITLILQIRLSIMEISQLHIVII